MEVELIYRKIDNITDGSKIRISDRAMNINIGYDPYGTRFIEWLEPSK